MPSELINDGQKYSTWTGLVYIFNLIVGTGALTLPKAFAGAGSVLGLVVILLLAFISLLTVTYVIEAMSIANALLVRKKCDQSDTDDSINSIRPSRRERDPLIPPSLNERNAEHQRHASIIASFEIRERVEMGRMASMFFSNMGIYLFYLCITIYLYGDLAIYITAVSKSLRDTFCYYVPPSGNSTEDINSTTNIPDDTFCWSEHGIDRLGAYRIFICGFMLLLGPFVFFNVQKTKHLQIVTTVMRWLAFIIMIFLASLRIINGKGTGHPPLANVYALPNFFGVCIYSFMCHHSLPSLVTPIANKKNIFSMFTLDYTMIAGFYLLLAFTGIYAFQDIQDLYTLNFEPDKSNPTEHGIFSLIIQYFLSLFPVFTLSTSFPIIAITLRNNLKALFQVNDDEDDYVFSSENDISSIAGSSGGGGSNNGTRFSCIKMCNFILFPLLAIIPPFLLGIFVEDVQILVSITGSYAGSAIQYFVPCFLVYYGRKSCSYENNPYSSPFKSILWLYFVLIWACLSMIFVTVHHFTS